MKGRARFLRLAFVLATLTALPASAERTLARSGAHALAKSTSEQVASPELRSPPLDSWTETPGSEENEAEDFDGQREEESSTFAEQDWDDRKAQLGITVGLPYFDDDILRPDVHVDVRSAYRFGVFVPHVAGGYRIARLDTNVVPDEVYANQLESFYFSVGARFELPVSRKFVPFIGASADFAWWSVTFDTFDYCQAGSRPSWYPSAWGCYDKDDWAFAPVYRAQLGFLVRPEPSVAIEIFAEAATIPRGDMFTRTVSLLTPSVGIAWHF